MGLFIKRPGGAALCFARCCGIDTFPPGDKFDALIEAILLFGFAGVFDYRLAAARRNSVAAREPQRAALYTRLAYFGGDESKAAGSCLASVGRRQDEHRRS